MEKKVEQALIKLHVRIRSICHKHDKKKKGTIVLLKTYMVLYTMFKRADESPADFMWQFKAKVETINSHGGSSEYHLKLHKYNLIADCKA